MPDLSPSEARKYRLFSALRALIAEPRAARATTTPVRPWVRRGALALLLSPLAGALLAACLVFAPLVGGYLESRAATRRAGSARADAPTIKKIDLVTNDLVYDLHSDTVYASVPGSVPTVGNSIVPIDPQTGALGTPIPVGSEPGTLALSDDGHYLYVGLDGAGAIQRVDLRTRQADLQFSLGLDFHDEQRFAETIAVLPGQPQTIAVARTTHGAAEGHRGVAIYRNGRELPLTTVDYLGSNSLAFCDSAATLYGFNNDSEFGLRTMAVDDSGVRELSVAEGIFSGYDTTVQCANNRFYATTGQVVDAATLAPLGTFVGDTIRSLAPDTNGQVLSIGETTGDSTHSYRLNIGDDQDFHLRWSLDLFGLPVEEEYVSIEKGLVPAPSALRRWGEDGVVFRASTSQVWIVRAPQIAGRYETLASAAPRAAANVPEVRQLDLAVNDLQYDARKGVIYASVSATDPHYGNSIVAVDPSSGAISRVSAVGGEPYVLALSDDRRYLYVGLNEANAVARIDLAAKKVDLTIPLNDAKGDPYTARAIVVLPGDSRTIVVGKVYNGDFLTAETVVVYTGGQKRAQTVIGGYMGANGLFFCDNSAILYGHNGGSDFYSFAITTDGVRPRDMPVRMLGYRGGWQQVVCVNGLLYTSAGAVHKPGVQEPVGFFAQTDTNRNALLRVDANLGQAYFATMQTPLTDPVINIYDLRSTAIIASLQLPRVQGDDDRSADRGPRRLIRWGGDGLAFPTNERLVLVRSPHLTGAATTTLAAPGELLGWFSGVSLAATAVVRRARRRVT